MKPSNSPSLYLSGALVVPAGTPGKLSIVMTGAADGSVGSTVPVVVRNNTSGTLSSIDVSGIARNAGALVGSGDSQGFEPAVVKPGEWAFGYVYFQTQIPTAATFDLTATGTAAGSDFENPVNLELPEVNTATGDLGPSIVGIVKNGTTTPVGDPQSVDVLCFQGSTLLSVQTGFTDGNAAIAPGGTGSFSIDLADSSCPTFAVGASGDASS